VKEFPHIAGKMRKIAVERDNRNKAAIKELGRLIQKLNREASRKQKLTSTKLNNVQFADDTQIQYSSQHNSIAEGQ